MFAFIEVKKGEEGEGGGEREKAFQRVFLQCIFVGPTSILFSFKSKNK